jgi:hypothetical protein
VIYHSVCKFSDFVGRARKNGFIKWPRKNDLDGVGYLGRAIFS